MNDIDNILNGTENYMTNCLNRDKAVNARKERHALKEQIKQQQKLLVEEKKKYKQLQKQVDNMAKLMGDTDDDEDEEEDDEEEETESEEESESEESEEEESESDDDQAPVEKRKNNLQVSNYCRRKYYNEILESPEHVFFFSFFFQKHVKKHEGRLAALKKGNYLLKAQVDRIKDNLVKQREDSLRLQEDLDSVLAELG